MFTLEDDRRHRTITTKGIAFGRDRHYIADWMVGLVGAGVRIRYMPHHTGEIEVFDADTGAHLGTAVLADAASAEDRARVLQARAGKARRLRSDLAAAERGAAGPVCSVDGAGTGAATRCDDHGRGRRGPGRRTRRRPGAVGASGSDPLRSAAGDLAAAGRAKRACTPQPRRGAPMTGTPRNPGPDVDGAQADHFLGLPGAHIVATDALMLTRDNIADVIEAKAMMCVHGDAGVGKTLSVNASLRDLAADTVCRVQFRARLTPRDIRHTLFDALGVAGTPPLRPIEFDQTLKNVLSERFRVLVCDEAQWMSRECFEYWRYLWDDRRTDIAIVFVGGGDCYHVLSREPMLSSRVYVWQEFRRMTPEQVLRVIPAFHPVWERTDPDILSFADANAGHGNFRSWAKLTAHTVRALQRLDRDWIDREVLGSVFAKMSGRGG